MPPCRCRHNKIGVGILLGFSFILSVFSALDCEFTLVDVGFSPTNTQYMHHSNGIIGIGLWTIEDVEGDGLCIMPVISREYESLTSDDDMYATFFSGSDVIFTSVRILTLIGIIIALINLVLCWVSLFSVLEMSRRKTIYILNMAIITFTIEGVKIGLMFVSPACTSEEFWERTDADVVSTFHKADQCFIGRGCYMSIAATLFYFCVVLHIILSLGFRDHHYR